MFTGSKLLLTINRISQTCIGPEASTISKGSVKTSLDGKEQPVRWFPCIINLSASSLQVWQRRS